MSQSSRHISRRDNNILFSRSAGQCNICKQNVPDIGERAHIIAHSKDGARGNSIMEGNNSYENLILLCPSCHARVDKYPEEFPIEKLLNIKKEHEESIRSKLEAEQRLLQQRKNDILCIQMLISEGDICLIHYFIEYLPNSVEIRLLKFLDVLEELEKNPAIYPLHDKQLQSFLCKFIDSFNNLWYWIAGATKDISKNCWWQHFSQAEGNPPRMRRLYEGISNARNQEIDDAIEKNACILKQHHVDLINYIRDVYPEVDFGY